MVPGAGTTNAECHYEIEDIFPFEGTAYYRLKQTDYDGKHEYFPLITVTATTAKNAAKCKLNVYPNPCPRQCNVVLASDCPTKKATISLVDALGNIVYSDVDITNNDAFSIDAANSLKPGVYIVMGTNEKNKLNEKVIVR